MEINDGIIDIGWRAEIVRFVLVGVLLLLFPQLFVEWLIEWNEQSTRELVLIFRERDGIAVPTMLLDLMMIDADVEEIVGEQTLELLVTKSVLPRRKIVDTRCSVREEMNDEYVVRLLCKGNFA